MDSVCNCDPWWSSSYFRRELCQLENTFKTAIEKLDGTRICNEEAVTAEIKGFHYAAFLLLGKRPHSGTVKSSDDINIGS